MQIQLKNLMIPFYKQLFLVMLAPFLFLFFCGDGLGVTGTMVRSSERRLEQSPSIEKAFSIVPTTQTRIDANARSKFGLGRAKKVTGFKDKVYASAREEDNRVFTNGPQNLSRAGPSGYFATVKASMGIADKKTTLFLPPIGGQLLVLNQPIEDGSIVEPASDGPMVPNPPNGGGPRVTIGPSPEDDEVSVLRKSSGIESLYIRTLAVNSEIGDAAIVSRISQNLLAESGQSRSGFSIGHISAFLTQLYKMSEESPSRGLMPRVVRAVQNIFSAKPLLEEFEQAVVTNHKAIIAQIERGVYDALQSPLEFFSQRTLSVLNEIIYVPQPTIYLDCMTELLSRYADHLEEISNVFVYERQKVLDAFATLENYDKRINKSQGLFLEYQLIKEAAFELSVPGGKLEAYRTDLESGKLDVTDYLNPKYVGFRIALTNALSGKQATLDAAIETSRDLLKAVKLLRKTSIEYSETAINELTQSRVRSQLVNFAEDGKVGKKKKQYLGSAIQLFNPGIVKEGDTKRPSEPGILQLLLNLECSQLITKEYAQNKVFEREFLAVSRANPNLVRTE